MVTYLGAKLVQLDDRQVLREALIDGKIKRQLQVIGFRIIEGDSMAIGLSTRDLPLRGLIHTLRLRSEVSRAPAMRLEALLMQNNYTWIIKHNGKP